MLLTSRYKSVNVLDFAYSWMITITHDILDGINETIHVDDGPRILNFDLNIAKPALTIFVSGSHVIAVRK